jgi:pyruvate dehydrogenase E1 component alpha subunit
MPNPEPATLFDHVYAGPHPLLNAERDDYLQYLAGYDEVS